MREQLHIFTTEGQNFVAVLAKDFPSAVKILKNMAREKEALKKFFGSFSASTFGRETKEYAYPVEK